MSTGVHGPNSRGGWPSGKSNLGLLEYYLRQSSRQAAVVFQPYDSAAFATQIAVFPQMGARQNQ